MKTPEGVCSGSTRRSSIGAPHTGRFTVLLIDSIRDAPGGYVITVEQADPDAELTQRTRADLIREAKALLRPRVPFTVSVWLN